MLFSPAIVEIGFGALAVLPYLKHGLDLFMYRKQPLEYPSGTFEGSLTVLLPVWNESVVIRHKLENVRETCSEKEVHAVLSCHRRDWFRGVGSSTVSQAWT